MIDMLHEYPELVGVTFWSGASAAYEIRRIAIGTKAGFWSGLMASLALALTSLLGYYLFLNLTLHTSWPHDTLCFGSHTLASCEMNDLLGGIVTVVLLLPVLGALLGAFAGFLGRAARLAAHSSQEGGRMSLAAARQEIRIGFPLIFCCLTVALFLVGIFTHLW